MARPQAIDYDAKRRHICQCAASCFAHSGYPNASMSQLAKASGLSKAGLYHYYASKEDVLFDVLDSYIRELLTLARTAVASKNQNKPALACLIQSLLATYATAQHQHRVLVTDTHHLNPALGDVVRRHQAQLVHLMGQALSAAYPKRIALNRASAHAMMVFGMLNWTFTWLKAHGDLSYHDYAEQVIATLEQGLN